MRSNQTLNTDAPKDGAPVSNSLSNMKTVVSDVDAFSATLRARKPCRIGVDGVDGVGKSDTSTVVASEFGIPVIGLDDYVQKNQGGYVSFIDYSAIAARIAANTCFVIEGVCLLEVLERLDVRLDCLIYIKRMSSSGLWADEDECEFPDGIEEAIRQSRQNTELMLEFVARQEGKPYTPGAADEPGLSEEIMRYHAKHSPHTAANITFCKHVG